MIDSLDTTWRFTAGVLSWHPDDTVTPEQEQRVMDDFEAVAFAGLEEDQRAILWGRDSHAGHHQLHFVIPRVELSSRQTCMEDLGRQIQALRREVLQLREGQQILMRHLQRLSAVHESLLPMLTA